MENYKIPKQIVDTMRFVSSYVKGENRKIVYQATRKPGKRYTTYQYFDLCLCDGKCKCNSKADESNIADLSLII